MMKLIFIILVFVLLNILGSAVAKALSRPSLTAEALV
jgi:hypothetical protein